MATTREILEAKILALVKAATGPVSTWEIARALGVAEALVSRVILKGAA